MKLGTVTGVVALGRKAAELEGQRILTVEMEGSVLAALDRAGAEPGDRVLVALSHAAGKYSPEAPADAVVVAVMAP